MTAFEVLIQNWQDTQYLEDFFFAHQREFNDAFWSGFTIDEAIDQVLDEVDAFRDELFNIDTKQSGYENYSLDNIFKKLHGNLYSLNWKNENQRKAKPNFKDALLRLYATELEDRTLIVTGGTIKMSRAMVGERFEKELKNLCKVEQYILQERIVSMNGLLNR